MYIDGGSYISASTLSFTSVSFNSCRDSQSSLNGMFIRAWSVDVVASFTGWTDLLPSSSYSSEYVGVFTVELSSFSSSSSSSLLIPLLYLIFTPSEGNESDMYVSRSGIDTNTCGWKGFSCVTISQALHHIGGCTSIHLSHEMHSSEVNELSFSSSLSIDAINDEGYDESNSDCV